jgi:hypothetical protein
MLATEVIDTIRLEIQERIDDKDKVIPTDDELIVLVELAQTNQFYKSLKRQYDHYGNIFAKPFAYLIWEIKQRQKSKAGRGSAPPLELKDPQEGDTITIFVRITEERILEWNRQVHTFNSAIDVPKEGTYYIGYAGEKEIQFWGYSKTVKQRRLIEGKIYQITGRIRTLTENKIVLNFISRIVDATNL